MLKEVTFARDSKLRKIGARAFSNTCIEAFSAPNALLEIGVMTFFKCYDLRHVQLNDGLRNIGELAFWGTGIKKLSPPR